MAKIYVSSTFNDLQEYREQVRISLRGMGHEDLAMEYYTAGEQRPVDKCLADVAKSDIYVGIFAFRYGYVPTGHEKSVTEQEYRKAIELNKPCFIFILKDDAPWPSNRFEFPQITYITTFRKELCDKHVVGMFTDKNDLAKQVTTAIYSWALEHGHIPMTVVTFPQFNLEKYYEALRKHYGSLALEGLTPPQKEEYLQIQLDSIFVEQSVRENPPPVELPKEVWEKLSNEKEIHSDDLPSGITIDDVHRARELYYEKPPSPVLDILTDLHYQYTILLGDPGSGKSTLARYVILSLIDPGGDKKLRLAFDGYLPLLIELRSYVGLCGEGHCTTFIEFLEYLGKTEGWALTQADLHNYLKNNGRAVVIFDGLDEIFEPEQREQFTRQIVGFCNDYPKAHVIVTSRLIGYRRKILTDAAFVHFTLQDLDEKQVESFITRWFDLALSDRPDEAKERRQRILKSFKDYASIRQLAGNPMLLTIMAIIGKHQELPRERWKLYDHAASVLIQHWDVNKHLQDKSIEADFIGEDDKKELLRRLAYGMQSGGGGLAGNYIHCDGLQAEFESYLIKRYSQSPDRAKIIAHVMIQQFRERSFILSLYGANLYGFVHRAFLEYFCASSFVWKFEKTKELTIEQLKTDIYGKHCSDQNWHEVLHLICGMIDEKWAGEIIGYLLNDSYHQGPSKFGKNPPWNTALAAQCLAEVRNLTSIALTASNVLSAIIQLLKHIQKWDIGVFVEKSIVPSFESIGHNWPNRNEITDRISRFREWRYEVITRSIAKILISIGNKNEDSFTALTSLLSERRHFSVRHMSLIMIASGWLYDKRSIKKLQDIMQVDKNLYVRRAAISSLAEYYSEDPETLPLLRERAVKDEDADVRRAIIAALMRYYHDNPEVLLFVRERAIKDKDIDVRRTAISVLAQYNNKDPETLPLLRERAVKDRDVDVRGAAVFALVRYYGEESEILAMAWEWVLNSKHAEVRSSAASALAQYNNKDPETLPLLRERAVKDEDADVRSSAISVLAQYNNKDPETLPLLRERAIKDEDADVQSSAISALIRYYGEEPEILAMAREWALSSKRAEIRSSAIFALAEYHSEDPETLPLLRERAVKDEDADVRRTAVSALSEYYSENLESLSVLRERAVNDLSPTVDDTNDKYYPREAAIEALARNWSEHRETLPLLRECAKKDPTQWLRERTKELIEQLEA